MLLSERRLVPGFEVTDDTWILHGVKKEKHAKGHNGALMLNGRGLLVQALVVCPGELPPF
jgi:hypothetical protein